MFLFDRMSIAAGRVLSSCLFAATTLGVTPGAAVAAETPVPTTTCTGSGVEFVGFSDVLNKTSFGGFAVNELSGLTYDERTDTYLAVADRAGAVQSHVFSLRIPAGLRDGGPAVSSVTGLQDNAGAPYTGFTFDGEGIAVAASGELLIASESGSAVGQQPEIRRFTAGGQELESLAVPARFLIGTNNLSFESLSVSPNGHSLFTVTEGPLAADGRTADLRSRVRILRYYDHAGEGFEPAEEYFYLTEPGRTLADVGVAEVIAVTETELLVLERGFVAGQGNTIRIFEVSIQGAEDVSGEATLSEPGLHPLNKTLLVDLATCPNGGATRPDGATQPNDLLDNFEAMTLGPWLPGGTRSLVLLSDDNGSAVQTTRVVMLGVPPQLMAPRPF